MKVNTGVIVLPKTRKRRGIKNKLRIFRIDRLTVFTSAFLLAGVMFGSVTISFGNGALCKAVCGIVGSGLASKSAGTFAGNFLRFALAQFLLAAICCLGADCINGVVIVVAVLFSKGVSIGFVGAYVCRAFGFSGMLFHAGALTIPAALSSVALLIICSSAFRRSVRLRKLAYSGSGTRLREMPSGVMHALAIAMSVICAAALIESYLFSALSFLING